MAAELVVSAAGMVVSAVVQEAVSRGVSSVMSSREEKASEKHNMERLEEVHDNLAFALQFSRRLPIIDSSLLHKRRNLKRAYEECRDVVQRCKQQQEQEEQQGATQSQTRSTSSFPRKFIDAVNKRTKYIGSWLGLKGDELRLSSSSVARFEQFAGMADKFVRDVKTGCTLSHYRFIIPLTRLILDMKPLLFVKMQGRRRADLYIEPAFSHSQERGGAAYAWISFACGDWVTRKPTKSITLLIRLSDSTDVVGIIAQCFKSLGPVLKPRVEDAIGEIAELTTQSNCWLGPVSADVASLASYTEQLLANEESCCMSIGADDAAATSNGLPPQVLQMEFECCVPTIESQRSNDRPADGGVMKDWPRLVMKAVFFPYRPSSRERLATSGEARDTFLRIYGSDEDVDQLYFPPSDMFGVREHDNFNVSLREMEEMALAQGIDPFISQPDLRVHQICRYSAHGHGYALVTFERPIMHPRNGRPPRQTRRGRAR